jgi:hypothetical protein
VLPDRAWATVVEAPPGEPGEGPRVRLRVEWYADPVLTGEGTPQRP